MYQTRKVSNAFVRKTFCQAYFLSNGLQCLILLRAQIAVPETHSFGNWINILIFAALGAGYGYFIFVQPIKAFQLPGASNGED